MMRHTESSSSSSSLFSSKQQGREGESHSYHERLSHQASGTTGRKRRVEKAASCNMLDMICNKKRRTLASTTSTACGLPAVVPPTPLSPLTLLQLPPRQESATAKGSCHGGNGDAVGNNNAAITNLVLLGLSAADPSVLLQTLRWVTSTRPCGDKAVKDFALLAMKGHPMSLPILTDGCTALRRYVKAVGSLDSDCFAILLLTLANHSSSGGDLYLQYLAMDCIRVASRDSKSRVVLAEQPGSMRIILRNLASSPSDSRLQELGLSLLSYLVEETMCRKQIIREGGVDSIICAMKFHAANSLVQCNGAAALCWLVHLEHSDAKAALLANQDSIPTVLHISKRYVDNASVFGNCICILCGVRVGNRSVLQTYPELGSPARLLIQLGMRKNPEALKVQRNSMMLLRLATESEGEPRQLTEADAIGYDDCIDVVLACMKQFPDEVDVQSLGCRVLANLSANRYIRPLIAAKEGCINQVTASLMQHKTDVRVQQGACWFLHGVLHAGVGHEGAASFGGGLAVLEIMLEGLGVDLTAAVER